jgi:acetyl-CoA synthetase
LVSGSRHIISLHADVNADDRLRDRIIAFARQRLGTALAPREIVFAEVMPKNQAGKILRKELGGCA